MVRLKDTRIAVRIPTEDKKALEDIAERLNATASMAIGLFIHDFIRNKHNPIRIELARRKAEEEKKLEVYK
jgi:antitoxin component of RelBE/YafQ-DinJ toxin-antitoxin module